MSPEIMLANIRLDWDSQVGLRDLSDYILIFPDLSEFTCCQVNTKRIIEGRKRHAKMPACCGSISPRCAYDMLISVSLK